MKERMSRQHVYQLQPQLPKALVALADAAEPSLGKNLTHLVKLRASQLNRCAFCLNMHSDEARKDGESQLRLDVLAAWREAPCFDKREKAALAFCDALTQLSAEGVTDGLYDELSVYFDEREIVDLTAMIIVINSWNRVVAAMHFVPAIKH